MFYISINIHISLGVLQFSIVKWIEDSLYRRAIGPVIAVTTFKSPLPSPFLALLIKHMHYS